MNKPVSKEMSGMGRYYEKKKRRCNRGDVIENDLGLTVSRTGIFSKFTFEVWYYYWATLTI